MSDGRVNLIRSEANQLLNVEATPNRDGRDVANVDDFQAEAAARVGIEAGSWDSLTWSCGRAG